MRSIAPMRGLWVVACAALLLASAGGAWADSPKPPQMAPGTGAERMVTVGKLVIEAPPAKAGCFAHIAGKWVERPCLTPEQRQRLPHLDANNLTEIPQSNVQQISGGDLEITLLRYGGETDPANGGADNFSLQLNTSEFKGNNGHTDWVQFAYQKLVAQGQSLDVLCIWNVDLTVGAATKNQQGYSPDGCVSVDSVRAPQTGDYASIDGWVANGLLQTVAILPWATGSGGSNPDAFATSAPDEYGLGTGTNWNQVNGGFLGGGGGTNANLTRSCVTEVQNFGLEDWLTSNSPPPYPGTNAFLGGNTVESSNLEFVNAPLGFCNDGVCAATFDEVSSDWKKSGLATCYPQDEPVPALPSGGSAVFEDNGTQIPVMGENVHVCEYNALLIGIDVQNNRFLCSNSMPAAGSGSNGNPLIVDSSTHSIFFYGGLLNTAVHVVHVCPTGLVMVGWSQTKDWLICGPPLTSGSNEGPGYGTVAMNGPSSPTQVPEPDHGNTEMHACDPKGQGGPWVLTGLDATNNVFICMNALTIPRLQ